MGWGSEWQSPEDLAEQQAANNAAQAAEERAAALSAQRMKMSPFERQLLDVLGEIRDGFSAGDGGEASAEPVDRPPADPGSALPGFDKVPAWLRDLLIRLDQWELVQSPVDDRTSEQRVSDFLDAELNQK